MMIYALRRLCLLLITLLILSVVGFLLLRLSDLQLAEVALLPGWYHYLSQLLRFDFGVNRQGIAIARELAFVLPATLELCIIAFGLALIIGIPVGVLAGVQQGKRVDTFISFGTVIGYSAPVCWVALLLVLYFSQQSHGLPVSGRYDLIYSIPLITGFASIDTLLSHGWRNNPAFYNVLAHLLLPSLVLALPPTTQIIQLIRSSVAQVMNENYIRVFRIRGLSQWRIIRLHVLPNALFPLISKLGILLSSMITLAIIVEFVFYWPGMGHWLLAALRRQDYAQIQAGVVCLGGLILFANTCFDLLNVMLNPLERKEWYEHG